jgi:hypothetical protein
MYRESVRSPSWDTKQLRVTRHPMSCWTPLMFLTWPISAMAEILSGIPSLLCSVMMYPKSLP